MVGERFLEWGFDQLTHPQHSRKWLLGASLAKNAFNTYTGTIGRAYQVHKARRKLEGYFINKWYPPKPKYRQHAKQTIQSNYKRRSRPFRYRRIRYNYRKS